MSEVAVAPRLPASGARADAGREELVVVPLRRRWRWVVPAVLVLLAVQVGRLVIENPRFRWDVIGRYLFSEQILEGLFLTVWLTLVTMAIGLVLGTLLAVMRQSRSRLTAWASRTYVWFFRGTPVLVQLIVWYNLAALFPTYSIGIPFGPTLFEGSFNDLVTPITAAILGLALNEGAYMAEIVRAGSSRSMPTSTRRRARSA
ncbi:ABC transporter permease subunit [Zavarzinia sp.]|uniref:ABC transporter permease subunit n=1 Tax=Zavarzinia sp. TaxID=2027920 RepID=UPI0035635542